MGDNGDRAALIGRPALLRAGERRGILNLPGTDALPFSREARGIGSYGFVMEGSVAMTRPWEGLKALIQRLETQPAVYGSLLVLTSFCRNQLLIQMRKRGVLA